MAAKLAVTMVLQLFRHIYFMYKLGLSNTRTQQQQQQHPLRHSKDSRNLPFSAGRRFARQCSPVA